MTAKRQELREAQDEIKRLRMQIEESTSRKRLRWMRLRGHLLLVCYLAPLLVIILDEITYRIWPSIIEASPQIALGTHTINLQTIVATGIYLVALSHSLPVWHHSEG